MGLPLGWYSLPALEYSPTSSFFFASTLMTGWPSARNASGRVVDVAELGVAVHVLGALFLLRGALEAIAHLAEQLAHGLRADREALGPKSVGQVVGGLGRPAQRRHRIATGLGGDEVVELQEQVRVLVDQPLAATALTAHPLGRCGLARLDLLRCR